MTDQAMIPMIEDTTPPAVRDALEDAAYPRIDSPTYQKHNAVYRRLDRYDDALGQAVDDLVDVIEWLRAERQYDKADRLRTIAGRLARARRENFREDKRLYRRQARGWM